MCTVSLLSCVCQLFIKKFHDDDDDDDDDDVAVELEHISKLNYIYYF